MQRMHTAMYNNAQLCFQYAQHDLANRAVTRTYVSTSLQGALHGRKAANSDISLINSARRNRQPDCHQTSVICPALNKRRGSYSVLF